MDPDISAYLRLRDQGKSDGEIERAIGYSIRRIPVSKHGNPLGIWSSGGKYSEEVVRKVRWMRATCMTYAAISKELGIPPETVRRICKRKPPARWKIVLVPMAEEVEPEAAAPLPEEGEVPAPAMQEPEELPPLEPRQRAYAAWKKARRTIAGASTTRAADRPTQ